MRFRPDHCAVQLSTDREFPTAWITCLGMPAGHAYFWVDGVVADLQDIVIQSDLPHWNPFLRALGVRTNYRNRGAGTLLLRGALIALRARGISRVRGQMKGDTAMLSRWYRSLGFEVVEETGRLTIEL